MNTLAERQRRHQLGHRAEVGAALWLRLLGWRIVARHFRGGGGEIDIAARRGNILAIVEVKARQTEEDAAHALGPQQRQRIVRATRALIARHPTLSHCEVRFDVILIRPWAWPRRISAAFDESGH